MQPIDEIYSRYRDFVFRICSRYTRTRRDAEDLTQETFIKITLTLKGFRQESELSTWIYRVAVNSCLDHLRVLRRREKALEEHLDDLVVRNLDSGGDRILARIELDRILGKLSPTLRRSLFLTLAEGLSYAEAAKVLGLNASAVAKSVARFLKKNRSSARFNPKGYDAQGKDAALSRKKAAETSNGIMPEIAPHGKE